MPDDTYMYAKFEALRNLFGEAIMSDIESNRVRMQSLGEYAESVIAKSKHKESDTEKHLRIISDNIARLTAQLQHLEGTLIDLLEPIEQDCDPDPADYYENTIDPRA